MAAAAVIAGASLAINLVSSIFSHSAKKKAAKRQREEALRATREASRDISLLEMQQQDASQRTIFEADRSARSAQALTAVSASEAGVAGASVEALLGDIDRKLGEFKTAEQRNLKSVITQLQREKATGQQTARSRIAAAPDPSLIALGLTFAGAGLEFWAAQVARPRPSDRTNS